MIDEELQIRRAKIGFKKIADEQLSRMRAALREPSNQNPKLISRSQQGIVEIPCYDLLFNPEYHDKFMYAPLMDRIEG